MLLSQLDVDSLVKGMSLNDSGKGVKRKSGTSQNVGNKKKVCIFIFRV